VKRLKQISQTTTIMNEHKLNDEEFRMWREGLVSQMPAPDPIVALLLARYLGTPPKKPRSTKKRWTVLDFQTYGVAININGAVVVKGLGPDGFTLWIHSDGEVGTNSRNQFPAESLANETLIEFLTRVTAQIRVWADQGNGRNLPKGPFLLLRNARAALQWRRSLFDNEEASCACFFSMPSNEWPF
jgi:hypothetical protein